MTVPACTEKRRFRALDRGEVQGRINEIKRELRLI